MTEEYSHTVGILGAGTMGAGIAQVAAAAGWTVQLFDVDSDVVRQSIGSIHGRFDRLVQKQRMTADDSNAAKQRLHAANAVNDLQDCSLIIEAIVEDFDIKVKALRPIVDAVGHDAIIASNTSSLSITNLGKALEIAPRFLGMHFFNPAPLMKLVEVVAGQNTDTRIVDRVAGIAELWGKVVARAADVPGFIVNHVARPYYLEAFRIMEDGYADAQQIDSAMKTIGGFRMGPLELTDLIGQDINTATTHSVWQQLDNPPLLNPSAMQEQLVSDGSLGRKTSRGVYDYSTDSPTVALQINRRDIDWTEELTVEVNDFVEAVTDPPMDRVHQYVFARIVAALIVQGHLAHERGVASAADIDTALKYGVNYPKGPFEWTAQIGAATVGGLLEVLNTTVDDNRFDVPESLRVTT